MKTRNIALSIVSCIALALFCVGGQALNFQVSADEEPSYTKVAALDELKNSITNGQYNIEITNTITVNSNLNLSNVNFYLNPENTKTCFTLDNATLNLENCTIKANLTADFTNDTKYNLPVVVDTTSVKYSFINGKGNLTTTNCEFSNIILNSTSQLINIAGTADTPYEINFLSTRFSNISSNGNLIRVGCTTVNFGTSEKAQKCTVENLFCQGNGAFVLELNNNINLYAIDILNCKYRGNGFFSVNNKGIINFYSGLMQYNTGYPRDGGSWGTLIHLYDGTKFNMYGGEISYNVGRWAIIGTGRTGLDIRIVAGRIANNTGEDGTFETIEGTLEIEKDATIIGDVYNSGSSMKNSGTIKGNITIEDGSDTSPTIVENDGDIDGNVTIKNGTFNNKGSMKGKIDFEISTNSKDEPIETNGSLTNSGTMDAEINMKHGTIVNDGQLRGSVTVEKGNITNNKDFYADTTLTDGSLTNGGTVYGKTTVNGGEVINNNNFKGDITISGGTFTNNEECNSNVTIDSGNFNNNKNVTGEVTSNGGTFSNGSDATITGKVTLDGGTITNNGKVDGDINAKNGLFDNNNQIFGKIIAAGGTFTNGGKITGDVTASGDATFTNNGTINGRISGKITNNGTINEPNDFTWVYFAGGATLLLLIAIIVAMTIVAKRKHKKPASIQIDKSVLDKTLRDKQKNDD